MYVRVGMGHLHVIMRLCLYFIIVEWRLLKNIPGETVFSDRFNNHAKTTEHKQVDTSAMDMENRQSPLPGLLQLPYHLGLSGHWCHLLK